MTYDVVAYIKYGGFNYSLRVACSTLSEAEQAKAKLKNEYPCLEWHIQVY